MRERRRWVSVLGLFLLAIAAGGCTSDSPPPATAGEDAAAVAQQAPAAASVDQAIEGTGTMAETMPGCSGSGGACCGSCQEKMKPADAADKPMGGCPCQRARQARERAQKEQAGS